MSEQPRLRIVTGKGGVGKTSVATALALAEARRGRRVLVAEVNGRDRVTQLLGTPPVGYDMREVLENVHVVDMSSHEAIREYVLLVFRFESIYKAVFENRFVQHFLRLVPSLAELVMLGKLWFHDQEEQGGRPRFDVIILDAPATGHAISMLRAPSVVQSTVPPGPLRENARRLHAMLTDHGRTRLHVVTIPEEMPVNETIEIARAAIDTLGMALGTTFINQRLEPLPTGALAALDGLRADAALGGAVTALELREGKRRWGEENLQRLPGRMLADSVSLPRLVAPQFGRAQLEQLATCIAPALEGGAR